MCRIYVKQQLWNLCELISQIIFANKFGDHCSFCEYERKKPCSSCSCSNFVLLFVGSIVRANRLILWLLFCERQIHVIIFSAHFYKHQTTTTKANTVSSTKQKCEFQFFLSNAFLRNHHFSKCKMKRTVFVFVEHKSQRFSLVLSDFVCLRNDVSTQFLCDIKTITHVHIHTHTMQQ